MKFANSITYDRGSTFARWIMMELKIKGKIYFANAHHPWKRGADENINQRLRRVFSKETMYSNVDKITLKKQYR